MLNNSSSCRLTGRPSPETWPEDCPIDVDQFLHTQPCEPRQLIPRLCNFSNDLLRVRHADERTIQRFLILICLFSLNTENAGLQSWQTSIRSRVPVSHVFSHWATVNIRNLQNKNSTDKTELFWLFSYVFFLLFRSGKNVLNSCNIRDFMKKREMNAVEGGRAMIL